MAKGAQQSIMGNNNNNDNDNDNDNNNGYLCLQENPHHGETTVKCHFLASVAACI